MRILEDEKKHLRIIINTAVLLVALVSFTKQKGVLKYVSPFESVMISIFAPVQGFVTNVQSSVKGFFTHYFANINASKENMDIKRKLSALEGKIFSLDEIEKENIRLKKLLRFGENTFTQKILAQVVAWDSNSDLKVLRINKGSKDGLRLQAPVVTHNGLVGYIYRLTGHFADVLTILDPNNRVDGILKNSRSHGIIEGYSGAFCIMKYVSSSNDVELGEVVVSSGLGNIYPKGLKIGTVTEIERQSYGITQYLEIKPTVDFNTLEEVIVLNAKDDHLKKIEWEALEAMDEDEETKK